MDSLERVSRVDHSLLSGEHYLSSLLEQAYLTEALTAPQIEAVQTDCLPVLARQTQLYNGMKSSSIRVEDVEGVLESALFTIGAGLKEYGNAEDIALVLISEGAGALFVRGSERINQILKTARPFHVGPVCRPMEVPDVFYHSTAENGISGLFQVYRSQLGTQQIHIAAGYPLLHPVTDLTGTKFIRGYAEYMDYGDQFCTCFSSVATHTLLYRLLVDYWEFPLNPYGLVLTAALGCVLCGKNFYSLHLSAGDLADLKGKPNSWRRSELPSLLQMAFEKISSALSLHQRTTEYLTAASPGTSTEMESAVRTDTLSKILLITRLPRGRYRPV